MRAPETYMGWSADGKLVKTLRANDANQQLNPAEVKTAVENFKTVTTEQINNIKKKLLNVCEDADLAVIVSGTKTSESIEEFANSLDTYKEAMIKICESLYEKSSVKHDQLQDINNTNARDTVASTAGVVRVSK